MASDGDQEALAAIADIAICATTTLSDFAARTPERVRQIARRRFFWPFLKARQERFGDNHKHFVKEIQLGDQAPFDNDAVARVRVSNVAVKTAMRLLCRLDSDRHKNPAIERLIMQPKPLPDWKAKVVRLKSFSVETWRDWFEAGWETLLADHEGHPEQDPGLRKIGAYRDEHSRYEGAQVVATLKTRDANVRDGIKEKLRKAVERLARLPKKSSKK